MRTTAEAPPPAAGLAQAGAARRTRSAPKLPPASEAVPPTAAAAAAEPLPAAQPVAVAAMRVLRVEEGLFTLRIGALTGSPAEIAGMRLPAGQVSFPSNESGHGVEIVAAFPGRGTWFGKEGSTFVLRSPGGGGSVMVTAYGRPGEAEAELAIDLQRLDTRAVASTAPLAPGGPVAEPAAVPAGSREVQTEILLHIERAGDRLFPGRGWVGALGRRMRIEAFSVRPLERLTPADIEMKGLMPNGGETPWIPGGVLCGTRGRGLPLIGFAIRVAPQRADRFEVQYQGSFFAGGISEMHRNGDPCRSGVADDPLEAVNVRLIERGTGSEGAGRR